MAITIPQQITDNLLKFRNAKQLAEEVAKENEARQLAQLQANYKVLLDECGRLLAKQIPGIEIGQVWQSMFGRTVKITGFTLSEKTNYNINSKGKKKERVAHTTYELCTECVSVPASNYDPAVFAVEDFLSGKDDMWMCNGADTLHYTGRSWLLIENDLLWQMFFLSM